MLTIWYDTKRIPGKVTAVASTTAFNVSLELVDTHGEDRVISDHTCKLELLNAPSFVLDGTTYRRRRGLGCRTPSFVAEDRGTYNTWYDGTCTCPTPLSVVVSACTTLGGNVRPVLYLY